MGKVVQTAEGVSRELVPAVIRTGLSVPLLVQPRYGSIRGRRARYFPVADARQNRARRPFRKSRYENYARDHGLFSECMEYVQPVVSLGQTSRILRTYERVQEQIIREGIGEIDTGNRYAWKRNMLLSLTRRLCQAVWLWQFKSGRLDIGLVMYLSMLTDDLFNSFWSYASLIERVYEGMEPTRVLLNMLAEEPDIRDAKDARPMPVPDGIGIEIEELCFAYACGEPVLSKLICRSHLEPS